MMHEDKDIGELFAGLENEFDDSFTQDLMDGLPAKKDRRLAKAGFQVGIVTLSLVIAYVSSLHTTLFTISYSVADRLTQTVGRAIDRFDLWL